jgi:uncharacterized protein involved in high-affinity Fe2+ transport
VICIIAPENDMSGFLETEFIPYLFMQLTLKRRKASQLQELALLGYIYFLQG